MSCPHCDSNDTRLSEHGFALDTYYCNRCESSYKKISKPVKVVGGTFIGGALFGPIGALIGGVLGGGAEGDIDI